jgi:hypothetical protein
MIAAMCGRPVEDTVPLDPSQAEVATKLLPPGGPTPNDLAGGESVADGFMDYSTQDYPTVAGIRGGSKKRSRVS